MSSPASPAPLRFAGFPLSAWAFGLRIWVAMMAALYAAFWLQLESASSAAVCVGILALPTRGQAYQKALYRLLGTVVGGVASIVIAGLFNGSRDLFILAFGGWMALCVYGASLLDGNRAYGTVLSGYTVAVVAVANIDAPQGVFEAAINRGAAITVGIAALMLFNDLLAAPDVYPGLLARMEALHRRVRVFARAVLVEGDADPNDVAGLLKSITALHADITALPSESIAGRARAAAARTATAAMTREVSAAEAAGAVLASLGDKAEAEAVAAALEGSDAAATATGRRIEAALDRGGAASPSFIAACAARVMLEQNQVTAAALEDMRSGQGPLRGPHLPLYRAREAALRNAIRVFVAVTLGAAFFVVTGWPSTSFALTLLGATSGLSATNPNPRQFARAALIAMPIAAALAGVTEFLVLDGVDDFPLLALGMAPVVIGAGLLLGSGKPKLVPIGFLIMVFFPVLLGPSNPQSYDPQTFLINSTLAVVAVIALFIVLETVLPTSDALKRRWILGSIRADLRRALDAPALRMTAEEASVRDADRIGQLGDLRADGVEDQKTDLRNGLRCAALASAAWRVRTALNAAHLPSGAEAEGRAALKGADPAALRGAADRLLEGLAGAAADEVTACRRAAATLAWMAELIEHAPHGDALDMVRAR